MINPFARGALSFDVVPHVGILPIRLDATREDVARDMRDMGYTKSSTLDQTDRYIDGAVGVEFDRNDRAQFVELYPHRDLVVTYFGVDVFDRRAELIFSLIAEHEGDNIYAFDPHEHLFRKQIVHCGMPIHSTISAAIAFPSGAPSVSATGTTLRSSMR